MEFQINARRGGNDARVGAPVYTDMKIAHGSRGDNTRRRVPVRWLHSGLVAALTVLLMPLLVRGATPSEPKQLPDLAVRKQTQIQDPVATAARLSREIATDAPPEPGVGGWFALSPDATRLAFVFNYFNRLVPGDDPRIRIQRLSDGAQSEFLVSAWKGKRHSVRGVQWSRDGRQLIFHSPGPNPGDHAPSAIWICSLDGKRLRRLTPAAMSAEAPALSPDGRRLAFVKYPPQRGRGDLYVLNLSSKGITRLISEGVFGHAHWSPDGKWIAFLRTDPRTDEDYLEVVMSNGKQRHWIASLSAIRREYPKMNLITSGFVWLPDSSNLLVTMHNRDPIGYEIWKMGLHQTPSRLAQGEVLTETSDGRRVMLKMDERYWLVELGNASVRTSDKQ